MSIAIKTPTGGYMFFSYLEQVAEWLERVHHRDINIAEELEAQITCNDCDFEIDGKIYHYEQN